MYKTKVPREIALMKIIAASVKMMIDARPNQSMNFRTRFWAVVAAMNATAMT
jgi:hypothetical protein